VSLNGKVLGLLFTSESTRTSSSLKSAIVKSGGGWLGIEGVKGTYLRSDVSTTTESLVDSAESLSFFADFLAVRADIEPQKLRHISVPVLNAGMGDDHCLVAVWLLYTLFKQFGELNGLKIGTLGLTRFSPPVKSIYRLLSNFNMTFYEDSFIEEAGSQNVIVQTVTCNGSIFKKSALDHFIDTIDCLIIADCLGQEGGDDHQISFRFNRKFHTITPKSLTGLRPLSFWIYFMPRLTTDGRLTVDSSLDNHPKLFNERFLRDSVFCNIGILHELGQ
jgi:aspartate carbamoyltransferase catalytic subunit